MQEIIQKYENNLSLNPLLRSGILLSDSVREAIMATKRDRIRKIYPYAITPPPAGKGRWQTHFTTPDGKRKTVRARSEDELLDKLADIYLPDMNLDNLTFHELYEQWLEYKKNVTSSPNTIKRHKQHYRRYFLNSALDGMPIRGIDGLKLEEECNRIVKDYNLSRKEWCNVKTIINGMFELAARKGYISKNPVLDIKIRVRFRQVVKKTGATQTYNSDELKALNAYLDNMYAQTGDISFMAVRLNFYLGLRVGELVALKWEDCTDTTHLHIVREEIRDQDTGEYSIAEHTKTHQDRFVTLVPKAIRLLQEFPRNGEFVFMRDGERLTARQVAYVLEKYAERNGLATKSTHKMRKTYASNLNAAGVPLDYIREQLGHNNLSTTLSYIYNPLTEKETYRLMTKAL